jgi:hypothetical protein
MSVPIRVGTPQNIWGTQRLDMPWYWLPGVPERAFCILYLDPAVDRQSVLTAIYTYDKLGYAEVALLVPDPNRVLAASLDFRAFASLRASLSTRLVVIAWSPRLALLATWWHFPVEETLNRYLAQHSPCGRTRPCWLLSLLQAWERYARARWLGRS